MVWLLMMACGDKDGGSGKPDVTEDSGFVNNSSICVFGGPLTFGLGEEPTITFDCEEEFVIESVELCGEPTDFEYEGDQLTLRRGFPEHYCDADVVLETQFTHRTALRGHDTAPFDGAMPEELRDLGEGLDDLSIIDIQGGSVIFHDNATVFLSDEGGTSQVKGGNVNRWRPSDNGAIGWDGELLRWVDFDSGAFEKGHVLDEVLDVTMSGDLPLAVGLYKDGVYATNLGDTWHVGKDADAALLVGDRGFSFTDGESEVLITELGLTDDTPRTTWYVKGVWPTKFTGPSMGRAIDIDGDGSLDPVLLLDTEGGFEVLCLLDGEWEVAAKNGDFWDDIKVDEPAWLWDDGLRFISNGEGYSTHFEAESCDLGQALHRGAGNHILNDRWFVDDIELVSLAVNEDGDELTRTIADGAATFELGDVELDVDGSSTTWAVYGDTVLNDTLGLPHEGIVWKRGDDGWGLWDLEAQAVLGASVDLDAEFGFSIEPGDTNLDGTELGPVEDRVAPALVATLQSGDGCETVILPGSSLEDPLTGAITIDSGPCDEVTVPIAAGRFLDDGGTQVLMSDGTTVVAGAYYLLLPALSSVKERGNQTRCKANITGDINGDGFHDAVLEADGELFAFLSDGQGGELDAVEVPEWVEAARVSTIGPNTFSPVRIVSWGLVLD